MATRSSIRKYLCCKHGLITMRCLFLLLVCVVHSQAADSRNIVQYLQANGYTQLVDFLKVAGLEDTLATGVFTIFAPTDDAFAKLDPSIVAKFFTDPSFLTTFLKNHVTSNTVIGPLIKNDELVTALSGIRLRLNVYDNDVYTVNGIELKDDDVIVANGVIHKIDQVIIPSNQSAASFVATHDLEFRDLFAALVAADLFDVLKGDGPFTIFAPTDQAFNDIKTALGQVAVHPDKLGDILKYHIIPGTVYSVGLKDGLSLTSVHGPAVTVTMDSTGAHVNGATIVNKDVDVTNGVIHVIDKVLLPPSV